jgi:hypothetical protein
VPIVNEPRVSADDLLTRSRQRWAKPRADVEAAIRARHQTSHATREVLRGWE